MRVTHRLWKGLALALAVLTVSESALTIAAFWNMTQRRGVPKDIAAQRLLLARWFASPLLSVEARIRPYTGGRQRYLGDVPGDSPNMIEVMVPDALLGFRLGRNITAFPANGLGDESGFVWVTNDEGFASLGERDFHYGLATPAGASRVMIVGGSTVLGLGATAPEKSLPARVRSLLTRDAYDRYEVINAGVPGYDSRHEFLYVASELIQYKPGLLVVYDGWNDESAAELEPWDTPADRGGNLFKTSDHRLMEERFTAGYSVLGSARLFAGTVAARTGAAIHHSATFRLMSSLTRHIVQRVIPDRPKAGPTYDPTRVGRYEENLTNMLVLANRHGVRVALFLQPIMWIDGHSPRPGEPRPAASDDQSIAVRRAFYADARPMFARLRERYQQQAHVCIEDLSQVLKDTNDTSYVDSGHLSGRGNEIVADEIVKRLAACGVLNN